MMRLYPTVVVPGQDFSKSPKVVVPMQCMTLREIIKRFLRKETLAVGHDGVYSEDHGDVEKLARRDISEIMDDGDKLRQKYSMYEKLKKAEADKLERDRLGPPVLTTDPNLAKSAGGVRGGGESPPETAPSTKS